VKRLNGLWERAKRGVPGNIQKTTKKGDGKRIEATKGPGPSKTKRAALAYWV